MTTPYNEPVARSSCDPDKPCGAIEPATKIETQVDITAEIPEAPAEWPAQQLALQCSAMLQHQTSTEQGLTPAKSGLVTKLVFDNLNDKLEHLGCVAERIQKQREIEELRRLIAGKSTHACSQSLDALAEPLPLKRVVTELAMLPI